MPPPLGAGKTCAAARRLPSSLIFCSSALLLLVMVDIFHVLPRFSTSDFSHILPSLDKSLVSTADLLTLPPLDIARRAQVPTAEVKRLSDAVLKELHAHLGFGDASGEEHSLADDHKDVARHAPSVISTLDPDLDAVLNGGIPTGYVVEITGESGAGKTQFLLTLLLACQLPAPHGLARGAMYISTEAPLATTRLSQLLSSHPHLSTLGSDERPSLSRILSIQTHDLESQDHIVRYQVPVAVRRHGVGLVILDSVAANFRAEFDNPDSKTGAAAMAKRSAQLTQLGSMLRDLARTENIAVVVANQVADRFAPNVLPPQPHSMSRFHSQSTMPPSTPGVDFALPVIHSQLSSSPMKAFLSRDPLILDHQQRWFTGWGDDRTSLYSPNANLKTPSLGLVWSNQLAGRIALIKEPVYARSVAPTGGGDEEANTDILHWRRWLKVAFASWTSATSGRGVEFEIVGAGIRRRLEGTSDASKMPTT